MKVGADDKKKLALAIGLSIVALATVYIQFFSGQSSVPAQPRAGRRGAPESASAPQARAPRRLPGQNSRATRARGQSFEPVWRRSDEDENFDPLETDPTLRTDLLAAVRGVEFSGVSRNIFEFTTRRRAEPVPSPDEIARATELQNQAERAKAAEPAPKPAAPPAPPGAPKVNWKYYGFASDSQEKERRAFFLDGEEVLIGGEGDVFKKRYKIVRIGLTSAVIEDMQYDSEQTLRLEAPPG